MAHAERKKQYDFFTGALIIVAMFQIGAVFFSLGTQEAHAAGACNTLTTSEAGERKCGDICRGDPSGKWGDGSWGGGDRCCCTPIAAAAGASGGSSGNQLCTKSGNTYVCHNPVACPSMGSAQDAYVCLQDVIGRVVKAILGVIGSLALLMFVWGGFLWLSAAGEEKRIREGWNTMTWAVIGMGVIFGAYVITNFILEGLLKSMQ